MIINKQKNRFIKTRKEKHFYTPQKKIKKAKNKKQNDMNYEQAKPFENKKVVVSVRDSKQDKDYFGVISEVKSEYLCIKIPLDSENITVVGIALEDVKDIVVKTHVHFIPRRNIFSKKMDSTITKHIEHIKTEKEFTLKTRRYKYQRNGCKKRSKWSALEFEKQVAKWLTVNKHIEIYPFALVTTKQEEFLLAIDHQKQVNKITKEGNAVVVTLPEKEIQ